jgi:Na+-transporting NADH:ubiquinone oxidoreductase subunit NqrB
MEVQSSWAEDSIELQAESRTRDSVDAKRMRIFVDFMPQVYWILGAKLRESVYLSYLHKLSNNRNQ